MALIHVLCDANTLSSTARRHSCHSSHAARIQPYACTRVSGTLSAAVERSGRNACLRGRGEDEDLFEVDATERDEYSFRVAEVVGLVAGA